MFAVVPPVTHLQSLKIFPGKESDRKSVGFTAQDERLMAKLAQALSGNLLLCQHLMQVYSRSRVVVWVSSVFEVELIVTVSVRVLWLPSLWPYWIGRLPWRGSVTVRVVDSSTDAWKPISAQRVSTRPCR
eukprot:3831071-Amphidinium_carterae.1